ncbi:hypothetical protein [Desulfomarina sp.]
MKNLLDLPGKPTVFLQLVLILFFSCSLYFYLQGEKKSTQLAQRQILLMTKKQQIVQTERQLRQYKKTLAARSDILNVPGEIQWEEVNFFWKNISFMELLHRLDGVYSKERTFTLEVFSLEKFNREKDNTDDSNSPPFRQPEDEIGFKLKGYYLCLCQ